MNIRVQQVLDGELERGQLEESEAAVLAETEAAITNVLGAVPVRPFPSLGPAVMKRIGQTPAPLPQRSVMQTALGWLWTPRPLSLRWRPVYLLPAAAVLALLILSSGDVPAPTGAAAPAQVLVEFRLDAPQATHVALAGDFTNWQPAYTLVRGEPGVWTIVVPLDPGVHDYAFIIDGQRWVPDHMAPAVADGFGGLNSRVAVLPPDDSKRI